MKISHARLQYLVTALAVAGTWFAWEPGWALRRVAAADDQQGAKSKPAVGHEAFAGIVTFNPTPGVVITKAPPKPSKKCRPTKSPARRQRQLDSRLLGVG